MKLRQGAYTLIKTVSILLFCCLVGQASRAQSVPPPDSGPPVINDAGPTAACPPGQSSANRTPSEDCLISAANANATIAACMSGLTTVGGAITDFNMDGLDSNDIKRCILDALKMFDDVSKQCFAAMPAGNSPADPRSCASLQVMKDLCVQRFQFNATIAGASMEDVIRVCTPITDIYHKRCGYMDGRGGGFMPFQPGFSPACLRLRTMVGSCPATCKVKPEAEQAECLTNCAVLASSLAQTCDAGKNLSIPASAKTPADAGKRDLNRNIGIRPRTELHNGSRAGSTSVRPSNEDKKDGLRSRLDRFELGPNFVTNVETGTPSSRAANARKTSSGLERKSSETLSNEDSKKTGSRPSMQEMNRQDQILR